MAAELKVDRHVQGHAAGPGPPNVLAQKGVVRGADGKFFSMPTC